MMKSLLVIVAAFSMLSASAQLMGPGVSLKHHPLPTTSIKPQAQMQEMQKPPEARLLRNAPKKEGGHIDGFYRRPAGAFSGFQLLKNGTYGGSSFAPYLMLKPFVPYTYTAFMEGLEDSQYLVWVYENWVLNEDGEWVPETCVVKGQESIDVRYNYGYNETPKLFVCEGEGDDAIDVFGYQMGGYEMGGTTEPPVVGNFHSSIVLAYPSLEEAWGEEGLDMLLSSKTFCYGGRHGDNSSLMLYYSGCNPWGGNGNGWWFGKNGGRVNGLPVDGIAQAFEKPTHPYLLKQVVLETAGLVVDGPVDMTCKVYRLADGIPAYDPERTVTLPEEPGELIARGRATVTPETNEANDGFIVFTLFGEEDGLEYDITPTIDDAILIAIDGYNDEGMENLRDFSALIGSDYDSDEGYGELAYIKCGQPDEEGNFSGEYVWTGLNNFFSTGTMMTGLTIFITADYPYLTFNYSTEDGEYIFPSEGGLMVKHIGTDAQGNEIVTCSIEFYAWTPSEDDGWMITCNGEEPPEWLEIELIDGKEDGEFNGLVTASVIADPLPAGVSYREAVVRFQIPGDYIDYKFIQGIKSDCGPGDGEVNIADLNYLIDLILNEMYDNCYDVNEDGELNVADVNALIDYILTH